MAGITLNTTENAAINLVIRTTTGSDRIHFNQVTALVTVYDLTAIIDVGAKPLHNHNAPLLSSIHFPDMSYEVVDFNRTISNKILRKKKLGKMGTLHHEDEFGATIHWQQFLYSVTFPKTEGGQTCLKIMAPILAEENFIDMKEESSEFFNSSLSISWFKTTNHQLQDTTWSSDFSQNQAR